MTDWKTVAGDAARRLRRNGLIGGAASLLILVIAPPTAGAHGFTAPLGWWLLLTFSLLPLVVSVHLLFDAALFRLAASHGTEDEGLSAIDDVLSRMGLRARDHTPRSLTERLQGCRRLVWFQRTSLAIGALLYVILLLDAMDGGGA